MKKELSVVIPAYNEEHHIAQTLSDVSDYLKGKRYTYEILVVNDGSQDETASQVNDAKRANPQIQLINRVQNRGKGLTVREGILKARYAFVLFMDADNATRIGEWEQFESAFERGAEAVMASRHLPASTLVPPQPMLRRFLGGGYRVLCRRLFGLRVSDFNCGFKGYETALAKRVFEQVRMTDWTFDVEVLILMNREGVSVVEVPVRWEHREKASALAPVQSAIRSFQSLLRLQRLYGRSDRRPHPVGKGQTKDSLRSS